VRTILVTVIAALIVVAPTQAAVRPADRAAINRTLDVFVASAVRRERVAASYDYVTPQERGGLSRAQWAKGDIPVYPYPARGTTWHGWTLDYALPNEVAFELVLAPRAGSKVDPVAFSASVKKIHGRWLVDSFYPAASFLGSESRVVGPRDFAAPPMANTAGESTLGAVWILVPAGVGSLGVLALVGFLVFSLARNRRTKPSAEKRARDAEFWELLRSKNAQA
jgi:hypothetical protein